MTVTSNSDSHVAVFAPLCPVCMTSEGWKASLPAFKTIRAAE